MLPSSIRLGNNFTGSGSPLIDAASHTGSADFALPVEGRGISNMYLIGWDRPADHGAKSDHGVLADNRPGPDRNARGDPSAVVDLNRAGNQAEGRIGPIMTSRTEIDRL